MKGVKQPLDCNSPFIKQKRDDLHSAGCYTFPPTSCLGMIGCEMQTVLFSKQKIVYVESWCSNYTLSFIIRFSTDFVVKYIKWIYWKIQH